MFNYLFSILAMVSFGLSPIFYKYIMNRNVDPIVANQVRSIVTLFLMLIFFSFSFNFIFSLNLKSILFIALISFFGIFLGDTIYFYALKKIDVSIASPLSSTYSLIIAVVMLFFGEPITIFEILGGVLIILGIFILQERKSTKIQKSGIFLALFSAILYSISIILMNYTLSFSNVDEIVIFRIVFTIIFLLPLSLPKGNFPKNPFIWLILGIGGFFGIGIGIVFMLYSMKTVGVVVTGIFSSASPMITTIAGILIFKEKKGKLKILGISFILFGLILVSI